MSQFADDIHLSPYKYGCSNDLFSSKNISDNSIYASDMRLRRYNIIKERLLLINSTWYLCRELTLNIKFCINEMQITALICRQKLFRNHRTFSSIVVNSFGTKLIIRANTRTHSKIIYFSIKNNIHSIVFNFFLLYFKKFIIHNCFLKQ